MPPFLAFGGTPPVALRLQGACVSLRLVVEVDGSQHRGSGYDVERDNRMKLMGWTVVRVWAWNVIPDIEGTVGTIVGVIEKLTD